MVLLLKISFGTINFLLTNTISKNKVKSKYQKNMLKNTTRLKKYIGRLSEGRMKAWRNTGLHIKIWLQGGKNASTCGNAFHD